MIWQKMTTYVKYGVLGLGILLAACSGPSTTTDANTRKTGSAARPEHPPLQVSPAQAATWLSEGNDRFASGHLQHPRQTPTRRVELASAQYPFAIILGCSDSRTGPEVLFDQGLGDLFIVRTAGNVVGDHALGSIEYAAVHLHVPLIVVLGHERCGAVIAAKEILATDGHAEGHVQSLVEALRPAVQSTPNQDVEATCKANIHTMVHILRTSEPVLRPLVESGQLQIVGAYYNLDTGKVTFLKDD